MVVPVLPSVFGLLPRGTGALPPMPQGAAEAAGQIAASEPAAESRRVDRIARTGQPDRALPQAERSCR